MMPRPDYQFAGTGQSEVTQIETGSGAQCPKVGQSCSSEPDAPLEPRRATPTPVTPVTPGLRQAYRKSQARIGPTRGFRRSNYGSGRRMSLGWIATKEHKRAQKAVVCGIGPFVFFAFFCGHAESLPVEKPVPGNPSAAFVSLTHPCRHAGRPNLGSTASGPHDQSPAA